MFIISNVITKIEPVITHSASEFKGQGRPTPMLFEKARTWGARAPMMHSDIPKANQSAGERGYTIMLIATPHGA